jgi:hypothetical protein
LVEVSSRNRAAFDPSLATPYLLTGQLIAVRVNGQWQLYDPQAPYVPSGMLPSVYQGVTALISDPKSPIFIETPIFNPGRSAIKNVGRFHLSEEGDLDGDLTTEYSGEEAAVKKPIVATQSQSERERAFISTIVSRIKAAQVTEVNIENETDPDKPLHYACKLRIPGYASRTGKRLILAPAVMQQGLPAKLPATNRKYDVCFDYAWSEADDIQIDLPAGYEMEGADAPVQLRLDGNTVGYQASSSLVGGKHLAFHRAFSLPTGLIRVPLSGYAQLKTFFDGVHDSDGHSIILRLGGTQ